MKKGIWIVPEDRGGINTYGQNVFPAVERSSKVDWTWTAPWMRSAEGSSELWDLLHHSAPDLIHVQHEFGLFGGSKLPWRYSFPEFMGRVRDACPTARVVLTAHTVLSPDYQFATSGEWLERQFRHLANRFLLERWKPLWFEKTFGAVDATLVHSELQVATVQGAGCRTVHAIPHFVYDPPNARHDARLPPALEKSWDRAREKLVVVFGYFTPDKGQDVVIRALKHLPSNVRLVLAGGLRRPEDEPYYKDCLRLLKTESLLSRTTLTGFLDSDFIAPLYASASVVVAPFRQTSGSGSLAQAFAARAAIVASDLPLNKEMLMREPGCLELFPTESPQDCARAIEGLLQDAHKTQALKTAADAYARKYSLEATAKAHLDFYSRLFP
jgi:glycosyltransferase involved in cell wall biosynthesis